MSDEFYIDAGWYHTILVGSGDGSMVYDDREHVHIINTFHNIHFIPASTLSDSEVSSVRASTVQVQNLNGSWMIFNDNTGCEVIVCGSKIHDYNESEFIPSEYARIVMGMCVESVDEIH